VDKGGEGDEAAPTPNDVDSFDVLPPLLLPLLPLLLLVELTLFNWFKYGMFDDK
jgi:hypothetical protein